MFCSGEGCTLPVLFKKGNWASFDPLLWEKRLRLGTAKWTLTELRWAQGTRPDQLSRCLCWPALQGPKSNVQTCLCYFRKLVLVLLYWTDPHKWIIFFSSEGEFLLKKVLDIGITVQKTEEPLPTVMTVCRSPKSGIFTAWKTLKSGIFIVLSGKPLF